MANVEVKCVGCGHKQSVGPGEIESGEQPMCELCFMPMVPIKVSHKQSEERG